MQRNILIGAGVIVVIGLGVWAYFAFFTSAPSMTVAPSGSASLPVAGQAAQSTTGSGTERGVVGQSLAPGTPVSVSERLVQVSVGPVVPGEAVVDMKAINASSSPEVAVNYIERGSGNVFTYLVRARTLTRVNNKTIPGLQSATWLPDGSFAFVRYLSGATFSTINTYALAATSSAGFFLPQNISDINVSAAGLLTLASGVNGSAVSQSRVDGTHATTIFTTPLAAIRASYAGKGKYLVFTKSSASLDGDAFLTDSSGRLARIAGPLSGLVALASPSGKKVLISYVQGASMQMGLIDTTSGATTVLPVATIADKCVWAADDSAVYCGVPISPDLSRAYPDEWYQGAVQFSDRIWKIDVAGRYAQLTLDFSQANKGELDAEALAVDPLKATLVFVNKNDGSLWSYTL